MLGYFNLGIRSNKKTSYCPQFAQIVQFITLKFVCICACIQYILFLIAQIVLVSVGFECIKWVRCCAVGDHKMWQESLAVDREDHACF